MNRPFGCTLVLLLLVLLGAGCASEPPPLQIATPDAMRFNQDVYPVLLRDCSFDACHGSSERFFQVFGPGHGRLPTLVDPDPAVPAPEELAHSYDRARSMIDVSDPARSLLLRKPLEIGAGGSGHEGADRLGRNVYQTKVDPGWVTLSTWVLSQPSVPAPSPTPSTTP